ncbi:MAG: 4-(cytidine 5'-diphospho)-2-C-methyl-D-erythritol kinase [Chlamydiae bacterium]|nr:4-(cytidine 5'-diphospho)-2-C-methyl-D-erythritol kinase [Chlamydiota bacterium]
MSSKNSRRPSFNNLSKDEILNSSFDLSLLSPAKVNLFFKILFKRADGYHEIASLYQAISLSDQILFRKADSFSLSCSDTSLDIGPSNLIARAAGLFARKTGIQANVHIFLKKNIPIQAGLGGGSSNAATTLWAMNEIFDRPATLEQLMDWSSDLGSDVPFFFSSGSAYCTGRGEILHTVLYPPCTDSLTIVKPPYGLSTPLVFKHCDLSLLTDKNPAHSLLFFKQGIGDFYNDLEKPAFSIIPSLQELKNKLLACGFSSVTMSGSGTSFFCIGSGNIASISDCFVKKVSFLSRSDRGWYE